MARSAMTISRVAATSPRHRASCLRLDANCTWPVAEVAERLEALAATRALIAWVEEPCTSVIDLLDRRLALPVALDEITRGASPTKVIADLLRSPRLAALVPEADVARPRAGAAARRGAGACGTGSRSIVTHALEGADRPRRDARRTGSRVRSATSCSGVVALHPALDGFGGAIPQLGLASVDAVLIDHLDARSFGDLTARDAVPALTITRDDRHAVVRAPVSHHVHAMRRTATHALASIVADADARRHAPRRPCRARRPPTARIAPPPPARERRARTPARGGRGRATLPPDTAFVLFTSGLTGDAARRRVAALGDRGAAASNAAHLPWRDDDQGCSRCFLLAHAGGLAVVDPLL